MEKHAVTGGVLMMAEIVIYSSNFCPFCVRAKQLIEHKGLAFKEVLIDGEPATRQKMMQLSGRHTVPQIWIGDTHVGGCDELFALERAGELDSLVKSTG